MNFAGKIAVVTGAGSGIGQQLVLELLERGAKVAAVDRSVEGLSQTAAMADASDRLSLYEVDVTDREGIEAMRQQVLARFGVVDVVINNAGIIQPFVRLRELSYEDIAKIIDVNLYGTVYVTKTFLEDLLERPEASIANVSSMGGFLPVPGQSMYCASKAAVKLMTEALYAELIDTEVSVSLVMPGAVATNIAANSGIDMAADESDGEYEATPADRAARVILDGMEDGDLHILVGSDARLMSIASRVAPKSAIRLIQRQMKDLLGDADS